MPDNPDLIKLLILLPVIGCGGGFLSGLLGIGGGILYVPALFFSMTTMGISPGLTMHMAVATSAAIMVAAGGTSALHHYKRGSVDVARLKNWGPFIIAGVALGVLLASAAPGLLLKRIFCVLTMSFAVYMFFGRIRPPEKPVRFFTDAVQRACCVLIGMASSMIGVGGAIMTVPLMSAIGMHMQRAAGTASALGVIIAVPGTLGYIAAGIQHGGHLPPWSLGYVSLAAVAAIVPTSMLMAPVGVKVAHKTDRAVLRRIFAVLLVIVSTKMFMSM